MQAPTKVKLHQKSQLLELHFGSEQFQLPAEFLRVHSPSAEVKGHGPGQETLQHGKRHVGISGLKPAGNYALQIVFDDEHDSGIYSWDYLYRLSKNQSELWRQYEDALASAGKFRDPDVSPIRLLD